MLLSGKLSGEERIREVMQAAPEGLGDRFQQASLETRIESIKRVLDAEPALLSEQDLIWRILSFGCKSANPLISTLWARTLGLAEKSQGIIRIRAPIFFSSSALGVLMRRFSDSDGCYFSDTHTLTFTAKLLQDRDADELWSWIDCHGVRTLSVKADDDRVFTYGPALLKRFCVDRPPLETLTQRLVLRFFGGSELTLERATLLSCGEYFSAGEIKARHEGVIDLSTSDVTLNGFVEILTELETGEKAKSSLLGNCAQEYLGFKRPTPPGTFGRDAWKAYWGDPGDIPACPQQKIAQCIDCNGILIYIPASIDGEKITFERLLAHANKQDSPERHREITALDPTAGAFLKTKKITQPGWKVLSFHGWLDSCRYLPDRNSHEYKLRSVGGLPEGLPLTLALHALWCSGRIKAPDLFARCLERGEDGWQYCVSLHSFGVGFSECGDWNDEKVGALALW